MRKLGFNWLCIGIMLSVAISSSGQGTNQEYEKFTIGDAKALFTGIALAPDNNTLIVSSHQSFPTYAFDLEKKEVRASYDVGNWYAGSKIRLSKTGKYLVLQQLFFIDFALNKDREVSFEVFNTESKASVLKLDKYHDVNITADEKYAVSLTGEEVAFWNLETGTKEKSFPIVNATNSLDLSPDGKYIAVSHKAYEDDLLAVYGKDKKSIKTASKYKQMISIFDINTFEKVMTIPELYDIIYRLRFSDKGDFLFCYAIPHLKMQTAVGNNRQGYLTRIHTSDWTQDRLILPSLSVYEPSFDVSPDEKLIAITSNQKFPEVHLYDAVSGNMLGRFELSYRLFQKMSEGEFPTDGRTAIEFLPDSRSIVMVYGNRLLIWKLNL